MRIRTSILALGLTIGALAAAPAFAAGAQAASSAKAMTAQQTKMADCSHQSKGMKGEEHQKFMSDCLHGKTTATKPVDAARIPSHSNSTNNRTEAAAAPAASTPAKATQQEKMKTCNADASAKALKGDERKNFMSTCLKG